MTDPDRRIWSDTLAQLQQQHPNLCRHWFSELEPVGIADGCLLLRAHRDVHCAYLRRECLDAFNDAVRTATNRLIAIRFLAPDDLAPIGLSSTPEEATARNTTQRARRDTKNQQRVELAATRSVSKAATRAKAADATRDTTEREETVALMDPDPINPTSDGTGRTRENAPAGRPAERPDHTNATTKPEAPADERRAKDTPADGAGTAHSESAPEDSKKAERRHYASESQRQSPADTLPINPDYGFENFVVGPGNRLAQAAAIAVAENPGRAYNPLFIHSEVGLGKTHLLQAICGKIYDTKPNARMHYVSCESFINEFVESLRAGEMTEFRHRFRDVDLLVIDDIHFLAEREQIQEEFFHTFNSLYQQNKQIVLSSDAPPEEIPNLEDRLVSRFKWGLVTLMDAPGFDTRVAILQTKAAIRGLDMPSDVAEFIAGRITTNIRELEGAIVTLQALSAVDKKPINLELAHMALGEPAPEQATRAPTTEEIITAVCSYYDVKRSDLLGKRRRQSISLPRQICMYLARELTRHSLEEVGGSFGGRDHTTVIHAVRSIKSKINADPELAAVVRSIMEQLRNPPRRG